MTVSAYKCLATRDPGTKKRRRWLDAILEVDDEGQAAQQVRLFKADEQDSCSRGSLLCAVQIKPGRIRVGEEIELESGWFCEIEEKLQGDNNTAFRSNNNTGGESSFPRPVATVATHRTPQFPSIRTLNSTEMHRSVSPESSEMKVATNNSLINLTNPTSSSSFDHINSERTILSDGNSHCITRKKPRTDAEILADFFGVPIS